MSVMLNSMQLLAETNSTKALAYSNVAETALRQLVAVEDEVFLGRFVYESAIDSSVHEVGWATCWGLRAMPCF